MRGSRARIVRLHNGRDHSDALDGRCVYETAYTREFDKFQPIYRVGDTAHALCILLSGGVNIERCDAWGHKTLLDRITPGSVFAETYACVPGTPMMVSAVADEPSEVLFLPSETLLSSAVQDSAHSVLLRNLLDVTAQKNLLLTRKIFHTSPKSMRCLLYTSFAPDERLLLLHRLSGARELPQAGSPYPGGSFSAPADRGTRTAAGGFDLSGRLLFCTG